MRVLRLLCSVLALTFTAANIGAAQDRHALVVGINAYENLDDLARAVNDGRAMERTLRDAGFTVDAGYDLTRRDFVRLLARFLDRLQPEDEALIFYAGHGVAIENRNFLVPSDISALDQSSQTLLMAESIGQDFLLQQVTATGVRLTVVIIDACRNMPDGLPVRSTGREAGLAITQPPRGVFLMYSADENQVAMDSLGPGDTDENSIFTRTLLPLLEEPGLDIVDIARRLRGDVQALAATRNHLQFPVYRDRMQGDGQFIVRPAVASPEAPAPVRPLPIPEVGQPLAPSVDPCVAARADWALIAEISSIPVLEAYRATHSGCPLMMSLVADRLARLTSNAGAAPTVVDPPVGSVSGAIGQPVPLTRGGAGVVWAPRFGGDRVSYWDHNGSGMAWESRGTQRWIWYFRPRAGIAAAGVTPGTLLFAGTLQGGYLTGQARRFSSTCGTISYDVSGPASGSSVTLQGSYMTRDDSCRNGYQQLDHLSFQYISTQP